MFEHLAEVEQKFIALEQSLMQGELSSAELQKVTKERAELEPVVESYREWLSVEEGLSDAKEMVESDDAEMRTLAEQEIRDLTKTKEELNQKLTVLLLPKDPNDERNVILEIRAGTGGDEAGIFAGDLLRMYLRYAESKRWKITVMSETEAAKGGFKEVVCLIEGDRVFSQLKFEMGVHRVQRVPETESQGRVHTSACTVAVLPEVEDVDIDINPADLRIDTYRSSGAGGQHVNTTDSAVRITHIPTGVVSECQDERSQHKNRDKAMKMLRSRIYDKHLEEQQSQVREDRKSQVGSGDRSERIRTYNYPQGRMTDHRINMTLYKLDAFMQGDIGSVIEALGAHDTALKLQSQSEDR